MHPQVLLLPRLSTDQIMDRGESGVRLFSVISRSAAHGQMSKREVKERDPNYKLARMKLHT